jgi:hypothetical protein
MRPPIASTMRWLIASPRPVPARAVDLVERLEHAVHGGRRNADAGVAHLEQDAGQPGFGTLRRQAQHDLTALGELDRVADKVEEHLLQPLRIADHPLLDVGFEVERELQPLGLGIAAKQRDHRHRQCVQRERCLRKVELAGLDLRVIEHVVQDRHQRRARRGRGAHQPALIGVERRAAQQFERAEHAVHRRADLVAHRRQELRLGHVGRLRQLLCTLQRGVRGIRLAAVLDCAGGRRPELAGGPIKCRTENDGQHCQRKRSHHVVGEAHGDQRTELDTGQDLE